MKIKNYIFLAFILSIILISGCINKKITNNDGNESAMIDKEKEIMIEDNNGIKEEGSMEKGKVLAGTTTKYLEFNKADYDRALAENKVVLLNFYANWCPICRAEQPSALAAFNELNKENVIGFRVNYKDSDTNSDEETLAEQFQIPYQHTKVIIVNGKQVLKSPDSWDKERYMGEISKYA